MTKITKKPLPPTIDPKTARLRAARLAADAEAKSKIDARFEESSRLCKAKKETLPLGSERRRRLGTPGRQHLMVKARGVAGMIARCVETQAGEGGEGFSLAALKDEGLLGHSFEAIVTEFPDYFRRHYSRPGFDIVAIAQARLDTVNAM